MTDMTTQYLSAEQVVAGIEAVLERAQADLDAGMPLEQDALADLTLLLDEIRGLGDPCISELCVCELRDVPAALCTLAGRVGQPYDVKAAVLLVEYRGLELDGVQAAALSETMDQLRGLADELQGTAATEPSVRGAHAAGRGRQRLRSVAAGWVWAAAALRHRLDRAASIAVREAGELYDEVMLFFRPALRVVLRADGNLVLVPREQGGRRMYAINNWGQRTICGRVERVGQRYRLVIEEQKFDGWAVLWEMRRTSRAEAEHAHKSLVTAYTAGASGKRSGLSRWMWTGLVAVVATGAGLAYVRAAHQEHAGAAPALTAGHGRGAAPVLPGASFDPNGPLPDELMQEILKGMGQAPLDAAPALTEGGVLDQQVRGASSTAFAEHQRSGPAQTPAEDVAMSSFGLGTTPSGCDPALKFKVGE